MNHLSIYLYGVVHHEVSTPNRIGPFSSGNPQAVPMIISHG